MTKKFTKLLSIFLIIVFLFVSIPFYTKVQSASQFSIKLDYSFTFEDNGKARVVQKVTSTNLTEKFYASEYSIKVHNNNVSEVSGSDGSGTIPVTTKVEDGSTILTAKLKQEVVGLNRSVTFQINYSADSFAIKRGKIWDISVPEIETSESVTGYQVTLSVPDSFGKLGKIVPTPVTTTESSGRKIYTFTKEVLQNTRIGASFGDFQQFGFKLKYRYKNPNVYTVKATIALPPDTEYQAMYYKSLDPKPVKMRIDDDGNYLADYVIKGGKNLEVIASGSVKIIDSEQPLQTPFDWTDEELEKYTKSDEFIESDNQQIQKKAKELAGIKEIYDYVATTLKYDYTRLETKSFGRKGAVKTINNPDKSICVDFADLFVALARAKGIPARGLVGYGYSDDTNLRPTKVEGLVDSTLLHAWPEYFDSEKKRWIQVDPTWGSTTSGVDYFNRLDTNHFVFVINGTSSTLPIPAGAYKTSENQVDDVLVEFSDEKLEPASSPQLTFSGDKLVSGFPGTSKLVIKNNSGRAILNPEITISNQKVLDLIKPENFKPEIILPFSENTFDIKLRSGSLIDSETDTLTIKLTGLSDNSQVQSELKKNIQVKPFFSFQVPQVLLLFMLILTIYSYIHHARTKKHLSLLKN